VLCRSFDPMKSCTKGSPHVLLLFCYIETFYFSIFVISSTRWFLLAHKLYVLRWFIVDIIFLIHFASRVEILNLLLITGEKWFLCKLFCSVNWQYTKDYSIALKKTIWLDVQWTDLVKIHTHINNGHWKFRGDGGVG